jgi:alanyl-tRNA synthetase
MRNMGWYTLPCVGLLAVTACAGSRGESRSDTPTARQVRSAQGQSEEALQRAAQAQKRASDQAERVAKAQRDVADAQARLNRAQEQLRQEQAKAEQFQREANEAMAVSSRQAKESQQQASRALAQQGEYVQRRQQTFSGLVTQATRDQLVVTPQSGQAMTFTLTDRTQVQVDGRRSSASEIPQGGDARVAYEVSGTEPTAVLVQVMTGHPATGQPRAPTEPGATEPSAPQAPAGSPQQR